MREERRVVTALAADLVGSTSLGERLDPEEARLVVGDAVAQMVHAVEGFGGTFDTRDPDWKTDVQAQAITDIISGDQRPDVLVIHSPDLNSFNKLLKKAQAARIPVIAFDSGVDSDIPVTTATTDNKAAAALAADKMATLIGEAGEVALVVHDQTSRTGNRGDAAALGADAGAELKSRAPSDFFG